MFLIHGIRRLELSGHLLPGACPICESPGTTQLYVMQPYVHLFWVPLFPLPKRGRSKCMNCGYELKHRDLSLQTRALFNDLKKLVRTPWWTFSGGAVFAVALAFFVPAMMDHNARQDQLVLQPQVGDVWTMKLGYKRYTLYRVEEVRPDSVFVRTNAREVEGGVLQLSQFQLEAGNDFTGERIGYARAELPRLDKQGSLHSVERPKDRKS